MDAPFNLCPSLHIALAGLLVVTYLRHTGGVEVVPGAVWESEGFPGQPTYKMPYVSGQVERIFGYTPAECRAHPSFWTSITHPDDIAIVLRDLAKIA